VTVSSKKQKLRELDNDSMYMITATFMTIFFNWYTNLLREAC